MSSDLLRYAPGTGLSRRVWRGLIDLEDEAQVTTAAIEAAGELQARKTDALGATAGRAMQNIALLSQMEQQLAQTVPLASGRLAAVADLAALALTQIVTDTSCRLRRY